MVQINSFVIVFVLMACLSCNKKEPGPKHQVVNSSPKDSLQKKLTLEDLIFAARDGSLQTVEKALAQGQNVNKHGTQGITPLMMASYNGHLKIVKTLIEHGASVNAKNKQGRTALTLASSGPFPETVKILLANGAEPNIIDKDEGWTPLMFAAAEGQARVVKILLSNGADTSIKDKDGDTALSFAEKNNHQKVVQILKK